MARFVCAWYVGLLLLSFSCEILGLSLAYFVVAAAARRGWAAGASLHGPGTLVRGKECHLIVVFSSIGSHIFHIKYNL
jgi:hypothetical protein